MTYNVFGGTLNFAQSVSQTLRAETFITSWCCTWPFGLTGLGLWKLAVVVWFSVSRNMLAGGLELAWCYVICCYCECEMSRWW